MALFHTIYQSRMDEINDRMFSKEKKNKQKMEAMEDGAQKACEVCRRGRVETSRGMMEHAGKINRRRWCMYAIMRHR